MANLLSKYVVPGCRVDLQEIEHTELDDEMDEGYTLRTAGRGYQSKVLDILSEDRGAYADGEVQSGHTAG